MARNAVAANLLMLAMLVGGFYVMVTTIKQEYLPNTEADTVSVKVALPGATPAEVEQSIVLALEDSVTAVQGIDKMSAEAREGMAELTLELGTDRDRRIVYNDIQQAVDAVTSFPQDAETPVVKLSARRRPVLDILLHGDTSPMAMRMAAEHVRSTLLLEPGITQVDIVDERDLELIVEVPEATLRAYGLTLDTIARTIRETALDRAGGTIETSAGELLLRLADRRDAVEEFAALPLIVDTSGTVLRLGQVASLRRGFADSDREVTFNGRPAAELRVYRAGDQTPISVAEVVRAALPGAMATLPSAIEVEVLNDRSIYYSDRMSLLTKNGLIGLGLVLLLLTLFLNIRLAFWVALGIPTAFMGAMLVLPVTDQSINLISMFAFIVALGIVVDDAIVTGENIHAYRQKGMQQLDAAIKGARDIAVPLSFSILTNIVAFLPLALAPGWMGKLWFVIPVVVSLCFVMSWIEALFVLPAHLAGHGRWRFYGPIGVIVAGLGAVERRVFHPVQRAFARALAWFTRRVYGPVLRVALGWRYVTVALMIAVLLIALGWVMSGRMGWGMFPPVPRDYSKFVMNMPVDTPIEVSRAARDRVVAAAEKVIAENGGERLGVGVRARINATRIDVRAYLTDHHTRPISTPEFSRKWRSEVGTIPSARSMRLESSWGGAGGTNLEIRLTHADTGVLSLASARLAEQLSEFSSVRDAEDGFTPGKAQLEFRLTEAGQTLGLTSDDVASQVRAAFFGVEALTQQEGRNPVTVRVRLPASERRSEAAIEQLAILTPNDGFAPFREVARVEKGRADSTIRREAGQRVVSVTANVEPRRETNQILAAATTELLPKLQDDFPGLGYSLEGRQAAQRDTMRSFLEFSIPLALVIIYGLLAVPFRDFFQPLVIMCAIPFGFVGAVIGHEIMGYGLSIISVFGMIALSGVVINAGIVMLDFANKARAAGQSARVAISEAGLRRFRPILLTAITTFCGLAPMILETSRQAQFLIPMAISLGYGIVFATVIVLFMIPALYLVLEDVKRLIAPVGGSPPSGRDDLPVPAE